jgi:hypothetical protein
MPWYRRYDAVFSHRTRLGRVDKYPLRASFFVKTSRCGLLVDKAYDTDAMVEFVIKQGATVVMLPKFK